MVGREINEAGSRNEKSAKAKNNERDPNIVARSIRKESPAVRDFPDLSLGCT